MFRPFPKLPAELRLKIWSYALPPPPKEVSLTLVHKERSTTISTQRMPSVFHACRESRAEVLSLSQRKGQIVILEPELYFDPEFSTIHFAHKFANEDTPPNQTTVDISPFSSILPAQLLSSIRHVRLKVHVGKIQWHQSSTRQQFYMSLTRFTQLHTFIMEFDHYPHNCCFQNRRQHEHRVHNYQVILTMLLELLDYCKRYGDRSWLERWLEESLALCPWAGVNPPTHITSALAFITATSVFNTPSRSYFQALEAFQRFMEVL